MLENILGASNAGLRFTTTISIEVSRKPAKWEGLIPLDDEEDQDDQLQPKQKRFSLPPQGISDSLNTLVRLLIPKLPQNHLKTFR